VILKGNILGKSFGKSPDIYSYPTGANIFNPPKTALILGYPPLSLDIFGANIFRNLFILDYPLKSIESKRHILNEKRHILNGGI
jgi:hypothetical protein